MDCMCDVCPNFPAAFGRLMALLMATFANMGPTGQTIAFTEQEKLEVTCPMINPLKCAVGSSTCAEELELGSMQVSSFIDAEASCKEHGYPLEPLDPTATTTTTTTDDVRRAASKQDASTDHVAGARCASGVLVLLGSVVLAVAGMS